MISYHVAKTIAKFTDGVHNYNKVTIPYSLKDIPLSLALFLTCPIASSRVAIKKTTFKCINFLVSK